MTNQHRQLSEKLKELDVPQVFVALKDDIPDSVHFTVGTSGQISVYSDKYLKIENLDTRPFPGGGYILVGASMCGGKSFAILKDFFADTLKLFAPDFSGKIDFYKIMTSVDFGKMAGDQPIVETTFQGSRALPLKRASITNISGNNFTPEYLISAFMKGIARELYDFFCLIPEELRNSKKILVGSGNAIRMNELLRMAIENQFNQNLTISFHNEEAAYGATVAITRNIGQFGPKKNKGILRILK
jgi:sedoheptulokinase